MTLQVTTSWDDGHPLDLRVAEILNRYDLRGTFYISRDFLDKRLSEADIRDLGTQHEIGAHTINHPQLTRIPLEEAKREIIDSKHWLEDVLGYEVQTFCYPRGDYNAALVELVRDAGFKMARTVETSYSVSANPFTIGTTAQIYPFPLRPLPKIPLWRGWRTRLKPLQNALKQSPGLSPLAWFRSDDYLLATAQRVRQIEGVWHLWGHSWEVEDYNLWQSLDNTLKRLSQHFTLTALVNSQLIDHDRASTLL